jgi:hypothetical protein
MSTKKPLTQSQMFWRHKTELVAGVAAYVVLLFVSIHELKQGVTGVVRVLWAVSPMLPATFVVVSAIRRIRTMDELQRRIHTEALALAAAGTALLGLTYGFLEGSAGFPHVGAWWAWVSVGAIWGVARIILQRRYQ